MNLDTRLTLVEIRAMLGLERHPTRSFGDEDPSQLSEDPLRRPPRSIGGGLPEPPRGDKLVHTVSPARSGRTLRRRIRRGIGSRYFLLGAERS